MHHDGFCFAHIQQASFIDLDLPINVVPNAVVVVLATTAVVGAVVAVVVVALVTNDAVVDVSAVEVDAVVELVTNCVSV